MSFAEYGQFCPISEYNRNLPKRIAAQEFREGDLYTVMMRLDGSYDEAAKQTVRLLDIDRWSCGVAIVRFAFLDRNLGKDHVTTEQVEHDLINGFYGSIFECFETGHKYPIAEGYFRDFFEEQFGPCLEQSQMQPQPA